MSHQGYGFCEFLTEDDAEYACKIMNQIKLFGKPIRVNKVRRLSRTLSAAAADTDCLRVTMHRRRRIGSRLTSERTFTLAGWIRTSTRGCSTIPSLRSGHSCRQQRCVSVLSNRCFARR